MCNQSIDRHFFAGFWSKLGCLRGMSICVERVVFEVDSLVLIYVSEQFGT